MEHGRERKPSREGWVEERCLGAGGFGTVTLYENKITKEQVALKRCRLELNRHNRKRWQQEVDIMKRLNHPNLVSAKDVPSSLDVGEGELPLLAMEFCSGGDLRKVLNSPESCCGLKEKTVLKIASDIAAAVEFLHGHRIIHRDLKPENVVLSHVDKKVVYKLIDLGYAKELDQGSLATTFVGTLKYLAPELLDNVQYTKTVDYWSFGTVLFECITGLRPFLPELSPVQWHNEVRKKGPDDICAYFDVKGDIQFSSVLPTPNALCRLFQDKFVTLLRLLLLWDPLSRGGPVNDGGKRQCFTTLEQVISTVVVYVFSFSTATVHSYEVLPTDTVEDLQVKLWEETGLDVGEQEVLMASGQTVEPHTRVQDCLALDKVEEDCFLFLLSTSDQPKAARPLYSIPPTIQGMVTEPKTLMSYEELKRAFALGVNFCREQRKICCLLFEGFRAALISLLKLNSTLGQMKNDLIIEFHKLESKIDSFNSSLDTDLENYADAVDILKDDKLLRRWKQTQKKVHSFRDHDVAQLKEAITALQTPVLELQKSAYAGGTQPKLKLDEMYDRAIQLYEDLRQRDRRQVMEDCNKMASVIVQSITMREKLWKDIFARLSRVVLCKREIREMMPRLHATKGELVQKGGAIKEMQKQRQVDLWTVLKTTRQEQGEPRRVSSSSTGSLSMSLSPVSSPCVSGDSLLLMESSSKSLERFAEVLSSLKVDQISQAESLDWKFLEEDHDLDNSGSV